MAATSKRVEWIDLASGILIIWMVLGHVGVWLYDTPGWLIFFRRFFFFFMPWFFYKSGMFFKVKDTREIYGLKKLVKPFVIWSIIGYLVYAIIQGVLYKHFGFRALVINPVKTIVFQNLVPCNEPIWFLLSLFLTINLANLLLRGIHPLFLCLVCIVSAFFLYKIHNDRIPDILANTLTGLSFFSLGFWIKDRGNNRFVIIVSVVGFLIALLLGSPFVDLRLNECLTDNTSFDYLIWFPSSLCGILVFNQGCRWLIRLCKFRVLTYIGRHAMLFLISHYLPLYFTGHLLYFFFHSDNDNHLWYWALLIDLILVPATFFVAMVFQKPRGISSNQ